MAEKLLLQTRLKSINSLLDNNVKQLELTRSKIASILTPLKYQQCQEFIDRVKEKRFIKVREREVRKLNNLINKKDGGVIWQSSQVPLATRASPGQITGRQAGRLNLSVSPQVSQSSLGETALPQSQFFQADSSQASPVDNTLSQAESAFSQAGSPQGGSSQASLEEITLSPESEVSQGGSPSSPKDSTL